MVVVEEQETPSMMYLYVDWVVEHQLSLRRVAVVMVDYQIQAQLLPDSL
tara:strand:- start:146 stop:292 length:147 start_codon:yes stop_codon:yes gene_type:complete